MDVTLASTNAANRTLETSVDKGAKQDAIVRLGDPDSPSGKR
jgi:hypothetical protein